MDRLDRSIEEGNRRQYGRDSGDNGKRNGLDGAAQGGIPASICAHPRPGDPGEPIRVGPLAANNTPNYLFRHYGHE